MGVNFLLEDFYNGDIMDISEIKEQIWRSKYKLYTVTKTIEFRPSIKDLGGSEELLEAFEKYMNIEYKYVVSKYDDDGMTPYDYIRIHINNTWAFVCEHDVYLPSKYYKMLYMAKNEYRRVRKTKDFSLDIIDKLNKNYEECDKIRRFANNRKMDISWEEYKSRVNKYLDAISRNFKPIDVYEEDTFGDNIDLMKSGWSDDNYAVGYINKSITGYFRNEYKKNMGISSDGNVKIKECDNCGRYFIPKSNRSKYCKACAREIQLSHQRNSMKRARCEVLEKRQNRCNYSL